MVKGKICGGGIGGGGGGRWLSKMRSGKKLVICDG